MWCIGEKKQDKMKGLVLEDSYNLLKFDIEGVPYLHGHSLSVLSPPPTMLGIPSRCLSGGLETKFSLELGGRSKCLYRDNKHVSW